MSLLNAREKGRELLESDAEGSYFTRKVHFVAMQLTTASREFAVFDFIIQSQFRFVAVF